MTERLSLLILSFSPIRTDPRVLKQVELFKEKYHVSTCAYGPAPDGVEHFALPEDARGWASDKLGLIGRRYGQVYRGMSAVQTARKVLAGRSFDMILANDINTLPLALDLNPHLGVHADLHEYAPREKETDAKWRFFVAPYIRWICKRFLPAAASVTTVSQGIADEYARKFKVTVGVVTNAAPYIDAPVRPLGETIRVIYSGAGQRYRKIESVIKAMEGAPANVQLDLIVMPNEPDYLKELRTMAAALPNVSFLDPVPYSQLVSVVRAYDVAMCFLPNTTFNLQNALPNKFFEAVQARVGVIVGPSPAMVALVEEYGLGAVADDFSVASLRRVLEGLTPAVIKTWKQNAAAAARPLSAEAQMRHWESAIDAMAASRLSASS